MKHLKNTLHNRLIKYNKTMVPMHMPGHKRNTALLGNKFPYAIDITEIHGFDNLHDMRDVLKETASLASAIYGAKASFPLVNGATCGILAAIHALAPLGSSVLLARNCHKSIYNAINLRQLTPHYICPKIDEFGICEKISPNEVEDTLKCIPNCSLVIITSPTYEGVISDISAISEICHQHGAYLLVDSAHGAHLGIGKNPVTDKISAADFGTAFNSFSTQVSTPVTTVCSSVRQCGADVVVMSLHKTMPALTQTALLHIGTDRVNEAAVKDALSIYETSSPSYVLLSSIDQCLRIILDKGTTLFSAFYRNLAYFYKRTTVLKNLRIVSYDDKSKLVISTINTSLSGMALAELLREKYHIEVEMAERNYVLAMTTVCDSRKHLKHLADALIAIDKAASPKKRTDKRIGFPLPELEEPPFLALQQAGELVPIENAQGRVCLEYIFAYPPGIPLVCPGEVVSQPILELLQSYGQAGITLTHTREHDNNKIWVE